MISDTDICFAGLESHPVTPGICGSAATVSFWRVWSWLVFSLWWLCCCWAATSTWCPSAVPLGSSCHVTGSPTSSTVTASRARSTVESSATCGTSSASAGRWCGSKCTLETTQVLFGLAPHKGPETFSPQVWFRMVTT